MKYYLILLLMFGLFACFRKKSPPKNIEGWLDLHFPGQYKVLDSNLRVLDFMAWYKGDKLALLADAGDPDLQFFVPWKKGDTELGLDSAGIRNMHARARSELQTARDLYETLHKTGLEQFSVGVLNTNAYIQVFVEPDAAARSAVPKRLEPVLPSHMPDTLIDFYIELMEPAGYHTEYQNVIPAGYWKRDGGWQEKNRLFSLYCSREHALDAKNWRFNSSSKRCWAYQDQAFAKASEWAAQHLPQPAFLDSTQHYGVEVPEKNGLAVRFGFPYFKEMPPKEGETPDPEGYVTITYDLARAQFSPLKTAPQF